ncbi:GAF domain-containing protein [Streptomyces sp. NPDC054766]|uniref:GAF domain-containing protein n=1 Tax=Streptomyces rhizosphaerihabitans TaxID=1266770 RepID=UPI0021C0D305|nr:GAF domain-containing protein [Streptomyces rhizosphaerihabitans]MCT9007860.1 GAF domain-containing protein [Streptomyces rhizosphaerihabitans]
MTYDPPRPAGRLLLTPEDTDAPARVRRLRRLGLGERSEPAFDAFADRLAQVAAAPYSMVNFIDEEKQFFAGLHTPDDSGRGTDLVADGSGLELDRYMARDHGFCPHVVVRRKALVLEDVCDYPRFAGNPVVDEFGVRSYLGAPLIDRSGIALGTICVVDVEPRPWGRAGLETIKSMAAELVEQLERREGVHGI